MHHNYLLILKFSRSLKLMNRQTNCSRWQRSTRWRDSIRTTHTCKRPTNSQTTSTSGCTIFNLNIFSRPCNSFKCRPFFQNLIKIFIVFNFFHQFVHDRFRQGYKPMWEEFPDGGSWSVRCTQKGLKYILFNIDENFMFSCSKPSNSY